MDTFLVLRIRMAEKSARSLAMMTMIAVAMEQPMTITRMTVAPAFALLVGAEVIALKGQ
jgi:hypothetical protein